MTNLMGPTTRCTGPYPDWPRTWFLDPDKLLTCLRERDPYFRSPFDNPAAGLTAGNRAHERQIGQNSPPNIYQHPLPPLPAIPYFSDSKIHEQKGVYHGRIKKTPIARAVIEILRGNS